MKPPPPPVTRPSAPAPAPPARVQGAASQETKNVTSLLDIFSVSPSRPTAVHLYMAVTIRSMARKLDVTLARRSPRQTGSLDGLPSPTSPLDLSVSRGWLHRDSGGVGLGILAALEAQPSLAAARVFASIASQRRAVRLEISELGCTGRCATSLCGVGETFPVADFLGCCDGCRRPLDGKDIFIYRGDRAFCSTECRYQAIVTDEFQEKKERKRRAGAVPLDAPKEVVAAESAGLPCADSGRIFFTGIGVV